MFLLVFKWRVCFVTHLQMALITLFLPSSLFRPAFPTLLHWSPAFLLAYFPDQPVSSFLSWPLLSPGPSHLHLSFLWALCFCLSSVSYLSCPAPKGGHSPSLQGQIPLFLASNLRLLLSDILLLPMKQNSEISCLLSPGICSWAVFCSSDHCVSNYLQNSSTRSVWNWFIFVLHFMTWLVWALSCVLHLQPPPSSRELWKVYLPGTMVLLIFKQDPCLFVASI